MKEYNSAAAYQNTKQSVITIGTFDGVHIGHKAILERLVTTARASNLEAVLLTFFPHPRMVLQKDSNIKLINTLSEKKELLKAIGIDHLIIQPFTKEFSRLTALEYVRDILAHQLKAKKIIIGYDHRFGRNRTANIENLKEYGHTYDFDVEEITAQELDDVAVSSTKIRNALETGDINTANRYLGYSYQLQGVIVKGKGIGRTLTYPTANLKVAEDYKLIPQKGVYLVYAILDGKKTFGLTSIGTNPTVGGDRVTIETYFLDFQDNLYDKELTIYFTSHIRNEQRFDSVEQLKLAIKKDEAFARDLLHNL